MHDWLCSGVLLAGARYSKRIVSHAAAFCTLDEFQNVSRGILVDDAYAPSCHTQEGGCRCKQRCASPYHVVRYQRQRLHRYFFLGVIDIE
jgi:hypothetical protein